MCLVSVVIPSYNHARYIRKAVDSVLGQSHRELELIVIDDGSKDESLDYLRTVTDPRFQLVEQPNAGAHNAINRGLEAAKGNYLAILNSDDVFHPTRLEACIDVLAGGAVDLVATWIEVIDADGNARGVKEGWHNMLPWPIAKPERTFAISNDFAKNLLMTNFVSTTSNVVFSRRLYERIGGMRNLRFAHDWDFLLRAARTFECTLISQPLLQYRIHSTNTISSNRAWMLFEICWVLAVGMMLYEGDILYGDADHDRLTADVRAIAESINAQGNDRIIWMIRQFIDARRRAGEVDPELRLLDDKVLRDVFIEYINLGDQPNAAPVAPLPARVPAGVKGIAYRIARRLASGAV
ncbi:glycosyltransferase [Burkholderia cenocepacia]|uniref:glycosyltransferase n=1 Tax=Burkholderia cenocepacia TaxID=95486 RepID=UPI000F5870AC|nr:glycosyltransferase [Burkholderia cenocepacia]RQU31577.1 glycosyltransferase [Burkholderia cenocepacia]RQU56411.1 glycosyltransferase [Burkholderia cenocepacia]